MGPSPAPPLFLPRLTRWGPLCVPTRCLILIKAHFLVSSSPWDKRPGSVLIAGGSHAWVHTRLSLSPFLSSVPLNPQVFLPKYRGDPGGGTGEDSLMTSFPTGPKTGSPFPNGHVGAGGSVLLPTPPTLCGASACDVSMRVVVGEPPEARAVPGRGICLDLAILDSAFLMSQVAPSLFMGSIVQLSQSVTAYMVSAAGLGLVAIYFATQVVFDKSDLAKYSM